ncbi:hypothetical protein Ancab_034895 [Ancistrocladus abbreviatus]
MIVDHELKGESAHPQMKNSIEATPMFSGAISDTSDFEVVVKEDFQVQSKVNDSSMKSNEADFQARKKNENALEKPLKRLQVTPHNQVNVEELGTKTSNRLKAGKQATPVPNNADVKNEVERILKATKDMVNLMHGDYDRFGMPKPKPPINNNGPKD